MKFKVNPKYLLVKPLKEESNSSSGNFIVLKEESCLRGEVVSSRTDDFPEGSVIRYNEEKAVLFDSKLSLTYLDVEDVIAVELTDEESS